MSPTIKTPAIWRRRNGYTGSWGLFLVLPTVPHGPRPDTFTVLGDIPDKWLRLGRTRAWFDAETHPVKVAKLNHSLFEKALAAAPEFHLDFRRQFHDHYDRTRMARLMANVRGDAA